MTAATGYPVWSLVLTSHVRAGRGSSLGPDTSRRMRWWVLSLSCGHRAERGVRYTPRAPGQPRRRRLMTEARPAPGKVRCHHCEAGAPALETVTVKDGLL